MEFLKKCSLKGLFLTAIFITDILSNWYLFSHHTISNIPLNQRCSKDFPELGVKLENFTYLIGGDIQTLDGTVYTPEAFYTVGDEVFGCQCSVKTCVQKCCPVEEDFDCDYKCVAQFDNYSFVERLMDYKVNESYLLVHHCKLNLGMKTRRIRLLKEDTLQYPADIFTQAKYCLDYKGSSLMAVACDQDSFVDTVRKLKAHCLRVVAPLFHTITFAVYAASPSLREGVGSSLMSLAGVMALKGFFNVVVVSRWGLEYDVLCVFIGLGMQFSWMASQTWQMVISFQIWSAFKPGPLRAPSKGRHSHRLYQTVAWSVPLLLSAGTLTADLLPLLPNSLKPQLGRERCWFPADEGRKFKYVVLLVDVTEVINLALCISTLLRLRAAQHTSVQLNDSRANEITWSKIYTRVCLVMGSAYFFVTITSLLTWNYKYMRGMPAFVVQTIVDIERLRGVEIFFIFIVKRKVFMEMFHKIHFIKKPHTNDSSGERTTKF